MYFIFDFFNALHSLRSTLNAQRRQSKEIWYILYLPRLSVLSVERWPSGWYRIVFTLYYKWKWFEKTGRKTFPSFGDFALALLFIQCEHQNGIFSSALTRQVRLLRLAFRSHPAFNLPFLFITFTIYRLIVTSISLYNSTTGWHTRFETNSTQFLCTPK